MTTLKGQILTLPKMSGSVSTPKSLGGNVGAKTINIGGKGDDGATFVPSVSADGIISWTNDRDLPNPEPVNIKGTKGEKGDKGDDGKDGQPGKDGSPGKDGADGFSPVVAVEDIDGGHRVSITDKDGAKTFDVMDGKDGQGGGGGVTSWDDLTDKPDFAPVATSGSWNDLTDKPFGGEISYDWVSVATGTYNKGSSGTATDTWGIPIPSFTPIVGTTYKIEAQDSMLGSLGKKTITAEAKQSTKNGIPCVIIGDEGSELYYCAVLTGSGGTVYYTGTIYLTASAWIYEEQAVGTNIIPLDPMYLPKEVVLEEELNQIIIWFEEFISQSYQTEEQVTALINNSLGVIENGTY